MISIEPIGCVSTNVETLPGSWRISDVEGALIINHRYKEGLENIKPDQQIYVIFHFHKSVAFEQKHLKLKPPHSANELGLFSTHSPIRPNPIGLSILEVIDVNDNIVHVKGLDILDGSPILDIKPVECPD